MCFCPFLLDFPDDLVLWLLFNEYIYSLYLHHKLYYFYYYYFGFPLLKRTFVFICLFLRCLYPFFSISGFSEIFCIACIFVYNVLLGFVLESNRKSFTLNGWVKPIYIYLNNTYAWLVVIYFSPLLPFNLSFNKQCLFSFMYDCVLSWLSGMFIHLLLVFFIAIISSSVLSYPNHWTGSIDFLFSLCPNHCLFCVNQNRLGCTAVKKNNISVTCHNKAYFLLRVLCSLGFSPQQLLLWQLRSQAAWTLWHLPRHTMFRGPLCREGSRVPAAGIQCISPELTAVISVDIPFAIN